MELSERCIQTLEKEEFTYIYEWEDAPGTSYPVHAHKGKVSLFVTDGSITFDIAGESKEIKIGQRIDVPVGVLHSAVVGPSGARYVVGEMIEGDS